MVRYSFEKGSLVISNPEGQDSDRGPGYTFHKSDADAVSALLLRYVFLPIDKSTHLIGEVLWMLREQGVLEREGGHEPAPGSTTTPGTGNESEFAHRLKLPRAEVRAACIELKNASSAIQYSLSAQRLMSIQHDRDPIMALAHAQFNQSLCKLIGVLFPNKDALRQLIAISREAAQLWKSEKRILEIIATQEPPDAPPLDTSVLITHARTVRSVSILIWLLIRAMRLDAFTTANRVVLDIDNPNPRTEAEHPGHEVFPLTWLEVGNVLEETDLGFVGLDDSDQPLDWGSSFDDVVDNPERYVGNMSRPTDPIQDLHNALASLRFLYRISRWINLPLLKMCESLARMQRSGVSTPSVVTPGPAAMWPGTYHIELDSDVESDDEYVGYPFDLEAMVGVLPSDLDADLDFGFDEFGRPVPNDGRSDDGSNADRSDRNDAESNEDIARGTNQGGDNDSNDDPLAGTRRRPSGSSVHLSQADDTGDADNDDDGDDDGDCDDDCDDNTDDSVESECPEFNDDQDSGDQELMDLTTSLAQLYSNIGLYSVELAVRSARQSPGVSPDDVIFQPLRLMRIPDREG